MVDVTLTQRYATAGLLLAGLAYCCASALPRAHRWIELGSHSAARLNSADSFLYYIYIVNQELYIACINTISIPNKYHNNFKIHIYKYSE